ncbi:MAG: DUF1553 domain-containing protein [Planctomycetaceae bacterium]|nr:DUF1553 domain-containing protein [Planctomycetaceae bacterium]
MSSCMTPLLVGSLLATAAAASENEDRIDYERDIKPLLRERCYACHGALKQESALRLDNGELIRRGGDSGPAVEAGPSGTSLLLARVADSEPSSRMPPEGEPLSGVQIGLIRRWIDEGAVSPSDERSETDPREHWSFRLPVRPAVPSFHQPARIPNPVDAFLAAERDRRGLSPRPRAEPHVLLRRVYLNLIGLPPTREEMRDFLEDPSQESYERVIDRLLADPRHGERWGRHWMDVWRYSDWYGRRTTPDVLNSYGMIWRWRDWIVRSLNDNRPYDEMVRMMLAADELSPTHDADLVATGFLVRNFFRWNYDSWKKDNVEHVSKAFLGLTVNCAHCHDHKYDPITHEDYFRLRAVFEPLELRHDRVPGEPDPGVYPKYDYGKAYPPITSGMVRVFDERLDSETYLYERGEARNIVSGRKPIPPGPPVFLAGEEFPVTAIDLPKAAYEPFLKPFVVQEELESKAAAIAAAEQAVVASQAAFATVEAATITSTSDTSSIEAATLALRVDEASLALAQAEREHIASWVTAETAHDTGADDAEALAQAASKAERRAAIQKAVVDLARAERAAFDARAKAAADANAQAESAAAETRVAECRAALDRFQSLAESDLKKSQPLGPVYPSQSTGRRAALAHWITDRANPLAARVAVNHIWRWHFGKPLVATTADFGRNGTPPTHPELLDWLAVELMDSGWDIKRLHRLIVTSGAFAMQSHATETASVDVENRWYWRFEPSRMEAEVVRDSLLHVSGALNFTMGGPDIDQSQSQASLRRSLYFTHHGEARMPLLNLFDAADPCDCYRRSTSVIPQQALALTNNEMLVTAASGLEASLAEEAATTDDTEGFVTAAFERVLSRPPSPEERELAKTFLDQQAALVAEGVEPSEEHRRRARRGLIRALFNHNDFVTIR